MISINALIATFTVEEQQRFVSYLEKKNKRKDTKNIQLFKLLSIGELSSKGICKKLYPNHNKQAYYALRKRLYQSIIDFVAKVNLQEENSLDIQLIKYLICSRVFLKRKKPKLAYKILTKAETRAIEHDMFSILNEIYHTQIQYADMIPNIDLEQLIKKYKANQKKNYLEDELNVVYAKIKSVLADVTYKGKTTNIETLLNNTLKAHHISINDSLSYKSLYQLINILSNSAFITKDYLNTEPFLIRTYTSLAKHKTKERQHYYHIQILYIIANTLFRNKKFKQSLAYLNLMFKHMQMNKNKYYNLFVLKHNLLLALNYNYSKEQDKAISILEKHKQSKYQDLESILDINLSLVMFYMQKEVYKKALQLCSKFYHTDHYYKERAGVEWVIKKNLIEIILHIELENIDYVESRLLSFKRHYTQYLKSINQSRVITYLHFVEAYYKNPNQVTTKMFKHKVENAFVWISPNQEDIFVMSFYAWLKSKMEAQSLYKTTLALVEKARTA